MKFIISVLTAIAVCCMVATAAEGKKKGDGKRPPMTAEQKEFNKKMVEKYDANKDGKLDKEERAKMSDEDKGAMKKLFPHHGGKKHEKKTQ
ncbi:MAG: hypothetical protein A2107_16140 [Verrucomicrobia bacterium GWF2_62_7]|nr:MAG: hypothetical protein A2107_16140 [Verrucomicrobia bacterium GWF2_62_7]